VAGFSGGVVDYACSALAAALHSPSPHRASATPADPALHARSERRRYDRHHAQHPRGKPAT